MGGVELFAGTCDVGFSAAPIWASLGVGLDAGFWANRGCSAVLGAGALAAGKLKVGVWRVAAWFEAAVADRGDCFGRPESEGLGQ